MISLRCRECVQKELATVMGEIKDLFAAAGVLASSNLQTQTSCVWLLFLRSFLCQQAVNEGAQNKTGAH